MQRRLDGEQDGDEHHGEKSDGADADSGKTTLGASSSNSQGAHGFGRKISSTATTIGRGKATNLESLLLCPGRTEQGIWNCGARVLGEGEGRRLRRGKGKTWHEESLSSSVTRRA